jgi:response regulator NasT
MRILVAEDEAIMRMGLQTMLIALGHEPILAVDGRDALAKARQFVPQLAILDINMPFIDGLAVAEELAIQQPMPIIILTAHSDPQTVERASELPIHAYLVKPVKANDLPPALLVAQKRFVEMQTLQNQTHKLEEKLSARKWIDKAKALLMKNGMDEEQSYLHIQHLARERRVGMGVVAKELLGE